MQLSITCTKCGGKTKPQADSFDDLRGAPCANCGSAISESELKSHFSKFAEQLARDVFGSSRLE